MKRTNRILLSCLLPASLCSTGEGHGVLLLRSFGFMGLMGDIRRPEVSYGAAPGCNWTLVYIKEQMRVAFCKPSPRNHERRGVGGRRAANPFRLPRLHPGIR